MISGHEVEIIKRGKGKILCKGTSHHHIGTLDLLMEINTVFTLD